MLAGFSPPGRTYGAGGFLCVESYSARFVVPQHKKPAASNPKSKPALIDDSHFETPTCKECLQVHRISGAEAPLCALTTRPRTR